PRPYPDRISTPGCPTAPAPDLPGSARPSCGSSRSSTAQVQAPWEPPPCRARSMAGRTEGRSSRRGRGDFLGAVGLRTALGLGRGVDSGADLADVIGVERGLGMAPV